MTEITKTHTEDLETLVIKKHIEGYDELTFKSKNGFLLFATYVNDSELHGVSVRKGNLPCVFVPASNVKSVE